jgi:hypothetical protein
MRTGAQTVRFYNHSKQHFIRTLTACHTAWPRGQPDLIAEHDASSIDRSQHPAA